VAERDRPGIVTHRPQPERELAELIGLFPDFMRTANTTYVNLRATLDDLDPFVEASKPVARKLRPFANEARPTLRDLSQILRRTGAFNDLTELNRTYPDLAEIAVSTRRRNGPDNDLVEATRKMPSLQRVATPAFREGKAALQRAQPVLEFLRPYTPDFVGWLRDFGQGASNYDANGHFARIQPIFNAFSFTDNPAGGLLTPIPPSQRMDGLETGVIKRCPGAASQPAEDGSAPYTDNGNLGPDDCDPSLVLPGP